MSLCILAPENSPSLGGVGSYVYNLATHLPKDIDIHILTINREIEDGYSKIIKNDNIHIHHIVDIKEKDYFFYNVRLQYGVLKKIKSYHKKYDFKLIHSHSGHIPHLFSQFQELAPIVVTIHATVKGMRTNIADQKNLQSETEKYMNLFSRIIEQGEKISFRKSDYFFPVSKFTLDQIKELYHMDIQKKSKVVYNATDTTLFKPTENDQLHKPVITFIGRFYAVKGFDLFVKALIDLKSQGYEFIPYLVGRGNKSNIHGLLKNHFKEFIIKDFVPYRQIHKIYNQSDIVVVPSLYENFPGVILEAMSCGTIVIASRVGGIPEIIKHEDNGLLFEKNNAVDLKNQIKKILDETVNKKNIQFNARNTICERFDWSNQSEIIDDIYRRYI